MKCSTCEEEKPEVTKDNPECGSCRLQKSQARLRQWNLFTGVQGHSHTDGPVATFPNRRERARQIW